MNKLEEQNNKLEQAKLLAIDTATSSMTVALVEGGRLVKEINSHAERNHSIYLVPSIERALQAAGWSYGDLSAIAVGRGPGSYTGVRIGVTVAKMAAWAKRLPVIGVSTLEAMAAGALADTLAGQEGQALGAPVWLVPLINGRRGRAYTALYGWDGTGEAVGAGDADGTGNPDSGKAPERDRLLFPVGAGWSCYGRDGIRPVADWTAELAEQLSQAHKAGGSAQGGGPGVIAFVGEASDFASQIQWFAETVREQMGLAVEVRLIDYKLRAAYIAKLGLLRWLAGETDPLHTLVPNYTQLAEAEVKWLSKMMR